MAFKTSLPMEADGKRFNVITPENELERQFELQHFGEEGSGLITLDLLVKRDYDVWLIRLDIARSSVREIPSSMPNRSRLIIGDAIGAILDEDSQETGRSIRAAGYLEKGYPAGVAVTGVLTISNLSPHTLFEAS